MFWKDVEMDDLVYETHVSHFLYLNISCKCSFQKQSLCCSDEISV